MVGGRGRSLEFPKHNGNPNCKRSVQHVRYSQDTNKALHKFMDECGVANEQP
jgi:hypothetical protein